MEGSIQTNSLYKKKLSNIAKDQTDYSIDSNTTRSNITHSLSTSISYKVPLNHKLQRFAKLSNTAHLNDTIDKNSICLSMDNTKSPRYYTDNIKPNAISNTMDTDLYKCRSISKDLSKDSSTSATYDHITSTNYLTDMPNITMDDKQTISPIAFLEWINSIHI